MNSAIWRIGSSSTTKLSQMDLSIADALQEKRKLAKSADCVGGTNILGPECFISTGVRASAEPDSADSVLLSTRDVGVQLVADKQYLIFLNAHFAKAKSKNSGAGFRNPASTEVTTHTKNRPMPALSSH